VIQEVEVNDLIDACEADALARFPLVKYPIDHAFIPYPDGWYLYERTVHMAKGTLLTSATHAVEHFYNLSQGSFAVIDTLGNKVVIKAPARGITKPDTRRLVYVLEDIIFTTYLMTKKTDPEEVVAATTRPNENPLLSEDTKLALSQIRSDMPTIKELT